MKRKSYKKIFFITLNIILIFFIASRVFLFKTSFLENFASNLTYPFLQLSNKLTTPFKTLFNNWQNHKEISQKHAQLKEENERLIAENIKLSSSLNFIKKSDELLNFQERYELQNTIFAKIIAKNFSENEHYFLINKGKTSGIKKDMIAIYKFQIIGRVVEVFNWYCKILLITDQSSKISAFTNNTNAPGIVIGQNKTDSYELAYTSHIHKIELNDFVISSGQGLVFPEGFCLGKIKSYKTKDIYHKITLEPLVDFKSIEYCLLTNQEKMNAF